MTTLIERMKSEYPSIESSVWDAVQIDPIVMEAGASGQAAPYLQEKGYSRVIICADEHTYGIVGRELEESVAAAGMQVRVTLIQPDRLGDVIADEASIVQLLLDIQHLSAEVVVAAGSGTLHDLSRYAAYTAGLPFVSVPTAPSVDGFNSKGAPIIIRGVKQTIAAIGPQAIFADLDILCAAPPAMIAAGFGDMLGKYTSLFDWTYGAQTGGEPFDEAVYEMTWRALQRCVEHVDLIGSGVAKGIRILIESLIESGIAMLLFGQSHSASGAEHHLSHYWEMEYLRLGKRQLLHGAKVGAACAEIAKLYHKQAELLSEAMQEELLKVPSEADIRGLLKRAGGPAAAYELGIDEELLARSLKEAHLVRPNRHTLLRAVNEGAAAQ
ncbi:sn-glycerol-1-phosphate dehydrogenase [Paenibacillus sp. GCM10023252]|uniref:sn-glycerol-1-phosphate dehydrogenase n=1 Tax=Paenibacillus sp. GCM10023252 TaxID=3252649 RepID=UPI0036124F63